MFLMNARSDAYALSDSRSSFSACSRLLVTGADAAKVALSEDTEVVGSRLMVAVGELDRELFPGGEGKGLSSDSEYASASTSDTGLGGVAGVDKCS